MDNNHNISPFFIRRINHHKFEKTMRKGISYIYYDSNGVDNFKWRLVKATLENYIYYKYNINIDELPPKEVDGYIEYMIEIYDPVLKAYYYNFRKTGKNQLQESNNIDQLKKFFFNKWDQEKKQGKIPNIYDISKLGLESKKNEIILFFMEYMGYDGNSRTEIITKYLTDNTFTEREMIQVMGDFFDGKLTIKFDKVEFSEEDEENLLNPTKNYIDLDANFIVLEGTFYDPESGQDINFSTGNNPFDDFYSYHEFKEGIVGLVEHFVHNVIESFGFNIDKHFNYIEITEG